MTDRSDKTPGATGEPSASSAANLQGNHDTLLLADRMAGLGTLVAGVAHEINNPITYVLGNLSELERINNALHEAIVTYRTGLKEHLGVQGREIVKTAESKLESMGGLELVDEVLAETVEGALRIRDLVRDLLSMSRAGGKSTAPINVHTILDFTLRMMKGQLAPRATLNREYEATRLIEGERAKIGQVFLNLIGNAIHACDPPDPQKHRIVIRTRDVDDGIEIEIEDSGPGIPADVRDRLFTPFFSTKPTGEGTGLGLFISRRIISDHGGSIDFSRAPSGGTVFIVRLPERNPGNPAQGDERDDARGEGEDASSPPEHP